MAIYFGLPGWRRHAVTASLALVKSDSPDMDLFAFQRAGQPYGIRGDVSYQVRALTCRARRRLMGCCFARHPGLVQTGGYAALADAPAASSSVAR
jgi:hypothetical protein